MEGLWLTLQCEIITAYKRKLQLVFHKKKSEIQYRIYRDTYIYLCCSIYAGKQKKITTLSKPLRYMWERQIWKKVDRNARM